MAYAGMERRRHKVYVTRNTEYHLRDGICVAVRDRRSSNFWDAHIALSLALAGTVKRDAFGSDSSSKEPAPGDSLLFLQPLSDGRARPITTSTIEQIERPSKEIVQSYRI